MAGETRIAMGWLRPVAAGGVANLRRGPARHRFAATLAAAAAITLSCAEPRGPALPAEAAAWAEGPVRWLLLPEERRELARVRSTSELAAFREGFWRRRDSTPGDPENPAQAAFLERVGIADRLYDEGDRDGSRTDRGRAFLLLGPPSRLRVTRPSEEFAGRAEEGGGRARSHPRVESWGWVAGDLDAGLREGLPPAGADGEWRVAFLVERGRARLVAGESLLEAAARAWVRGGAPPPGG